MIVPILVLVFLGVSSASVLELFERKLERVKSLKAVFVQRTSYSWYPEQEVSEGLLYAVRGVGFRIEYTTPEKVIIVSDGKRITVYNVDEREAVISSVEEGIASSALSFILFSKPLRDVFEPLEEFVKGDRRFLVLKTKHEGNVERVLVELDQGMEIRELKIFERDGTETVIEFIDLQENFSPPPGLFKLELPGDVRVWREKDL